MDVVKNYKELVEQIENTKKDVKRQGEKIELVAVSKTFEAKAIEPVIKAGHRVFGENKVQEALKKWEHLKEVYKDIKLHLIGPLQTNKVKDVVGFFDVIETVDRPKLAKKIAQETDKTGKNIDCFIQINTGEEPQKAGVLPEDADEFIIFCKEELKLNVLGLMCIPPFDEEPSAHFAFLKKIARKHGLKNLSMGMSGDYQIAIEQGATHVRVGSKIFGKRDYSQ